jgi:hypothetical protein
VLLYVLEPEAVFMKKICACSMRELINYLLSLPLLVLNLSLAILHVIDSGAKVGFDL